MTSQKDRSKARKENYKRLRAKLLMACPMCEVLGCGEAATDAHHVHASGGMGVRMDTYDNLCALCHQHHMEVESRGKLSWARLYFFGSTYVQFGAYVKFRRMAELRGIIPAPMLPQIMLSEMDEDLRKFALNYVRHSDENSFKI